MAMLRCLMKLQITGLRTRSNLTSGLLSKHHHHHQLKLRGIRAMSEGPRGLSSLNPNSKCGSPPEHDSTSSVESEIEKLRIEMKKMQSELRHISESAKSSARQQKEEKTILTWTYHDKQSAFVFAFMFSSIIISVLIAMSLNLSVAKLIFCSIIFICLVFY